MCGLVSGKMLEIENDQFKQFQYKKMTQLKGPKYNIRGIAISRDNQYLACGDEVARIMIWDFQKKTIIKQYQGYLIDSLVFSMNAKLLLARFRNTNSSLGLFLFRLDSIDETPFLILNENTCESVLMGDSYLVQGGGDQIIKIWDVDQLKVIFQRRLSNEILGIEVSEKSLIACWCSRNKIHLFDGKKIQRVQQILQRKVGERKRIYEIGSIAITPNSQLMAVGSLYLIMLWSIVKSVKLLKTIRYHQPVFTYVRAPTNNIIIVSRKSDNIIWEISTGNNQICIKNQNRIYTSDFNYVILVFDEDKIDIFKKIQN